MALKERLASLYGIAGFPWQGWLKAFALLAAFLAVLIVFLSPWKVLAAILAIALLATAYVRPEWLVVGVAVYMPFEPFLLKFVPDELYIFARYFSESLIYLLLMAVLARRWFAGRGRVSTAIDLPFALFLLSVLASAVANMVPATVAVLGVRQIIRFILLYYAVANLDPGREFVRRLVALLFAVALFQSLLGLAQFASGGRLDPLLIPSDRKFFESIQLTTGTQQTWEPGSRIFATLGRYDQLGTFLCFFLLLALAWAYELPGDRRRPYLIGLLVLGLPALVLTYSRASWFGFILGGLWIAVKMKRDKRVMVGIAAAGILMALYVAWSGIVVRYVIDSPRQTLVERFVEIFSYERYRGEYYGLGRVYWAVQTVVKVVPASPVFGHGPGTYGAGAATALRNTHVYDKLNLPFGVYGTEGYIDNNWFALWGETGTLGIALYLWMFWTLWKIAGIVYAKSPDRLYRALALGFMGAMLAVVLQAFLATNLEVRTLAVYFWLFAAILVVHAKKEKLL